MREDEQLDLALERVQLPERNAYLECLTAAYDWLDGLPDGTEITAGTLAEAAWQHMTRDPAEPRVWGAVMRQLAAEGRIERTDRVTTSGRSHCGVARIWRKAAGEVVSVAYPATSPNGDGQWRSRRTRSS